MTINMKLRHNIYRPSGHGAPHCLSASGREVPTQRFLNQLYFYYELSK